MDGFPILSLMLLVPLVGGLACFFLAASEARLVALAATLINLALGIVLWANYDIGGPQWQFTERADLFAGFQYALGIDGIALMLIMLSVFLMPICILASWDAIQTRVGEYMAAFLIMEMLMIGVFAAQDLFLFYIFFEAGLIPMYLIIGIWGGANRIYASYKFFLYTLLGSVLMLIAMLWMVNDSWHDRHPDADAIRFRTGSADLAVARILRQLRGEDADVAGPYLAARCARSGTDRRFGHPGGRAAEDGRLRLHPLQPADVPRSECAVRLADLDPVLIAVVYTSLVALVQHDMKKLIAYSSVAHMAIVTAGLFAFNVQGLEGAMIMMLSHGLVSGALFLCVGVIYDRLHTREISRYGGLAINMPRYALFFLLFTMASIGLPGTSGFVAEFLSLAGVYEISSDVTLGPDDRHHPWRRLYALSLSPGRFRRAGE